jgi:sugar phosphate permease
VAAGLWGMSLAPTIEIYNLLFGLTMAVGNAFSASMAGTAAISRWFTISRGRALGFAAMGTSVGGIAIPALVTMWLGSVGWRGTLENLALLTALLVAPLICLTVRGKPSDVGLLPEGTQRAQDNLAPADTSLTMTEIVRQPAYWYIGLSLGLLFCVYSAMLANITPYATNLGQSEARASSLIMVIAVGGLVGKLLFGMGADRFNLKFGLWAAQGLVGLAFLLLATQPDYPLMLVAAAGMGLAAGGQLPVWGAMLARVFGVNSFGRAMGAMGPLITLAILPGFVVVGHLYDSYGNYTVCLLLFAAVTVIAAAMLIPLRLVPVHEN